MVSLLHASIPIWMLLFFLTVINESESAEIPRPVIEAGGHTGHVNGLALIDDGRQLVTAASDKTIRFWDTATGECINVLRPYAQPGPAGAISAFDVSPDGTLLAVCVGDPPAPHSMTVTVRLLLVSVASKKIIAAYKLGTDILGLVRFSPSGHRLAGGSIAGKLTLWDVPENAAIADLEAIDSPEILDAHSRSVMGLEFSPDGERLLTVSDVDGEAKIWNLASGRVDKVLPHEFASSCAWSPDGATIATGSRNQNVKLWTPDGKLKKTLERLGNGIFGLAFSPDSKQLLLTRGGAGESIKCSLYELESYRESVKFDKHIDSVSHGIFLPDGKSVVTSAADIFQWSATTGVIRQRFGPRGQVVDSVGWSPDGTSIGWRWSNVPDAESFSINTLEWNTGNSDYKQYSKFRARAGDLHFQVNRAGGLEVRRGEWLEHQFAMATEERVAGASFMRDDRVVIATTFRMGLYEAKTGEALAFFPGHDGMVKSIATSPSGRLLVSGGFDRTIRLWRPTDEPIETRGGIGAQLDKRGEGLVILAIDSRVEPPQRVANCVPVTSFWESMRRMVSSPLKIRTLLKPLRTSPAQQTKASRYASGVRRGKLAPSISFGRRSEQTSSLPSFHSSSPKPTGSPGPRKDTTTAHLAASVCWVGRSIGESTSLPNSIRRPVFEKSSTGQTLSEGYWKPVRPPRR